MIDEVLRLTHRYVTRGVLVDANLFLLLVVGLCDPSLIARFKRTAMYGPEEFELLVRYLALFRVKATTPQVLTEVSNLAGAVRDPEREVVFAVMAELVGDLRERSRPSRELVTMPGFGRFGITDTAIAVAARGRYLVLSDDLALCRHLVETRGDALNFHQLTDVAW